MLKKLTTFALLLLATGTGLSLYLPAYEPDGKPLAAYQLAEKTLDQPVDTRSFQPSSLALEEALAASAEADQAAPQYALQLRLFGTLEAAKSGATHLYKRQLDLPLPLTIFKAEDPRRQWYILALGPFSNKNEAAHTQYTLETEGVSTLDILWPAELNENESDEG